MRNWRKIYAECRDDEEAEKRLTKAEKVMVFAETTLRVPEGLHVGQPLKLEPFQEAFIYSLLDNPAGTRTAVLSVARRNGKSFITAIILLAALVGPLAVRNSVIASAAMGREQAALIFRMMCLMIDQNPELQKVVRVVPSSKTIYGLAMNTAFHSLSAEARSNLGRSISVIVHDEAGAIRGPSNEYVEMLRTSQGSVKDPIYITISTQAPSDGDYLSVIMDDAERSGDPKTVVHCYSADHDCDMLDEKQWYYANPGLGVFRSKEDLGEQLKQASRLPSMENGALNLLLNRRVALDKLWLSASVWKEGNAPPRLELFRDGRPVCVGLDLSLRTDLTAAVVACRDDDGVVDLIPFVFAPSQGVEQRETRDRAPYRAWARDGYLTLTPGPTVDYEWVCQFLAKKMADWSIEVTKVAFDRWRIEEFRREAERTNFAPFAEWVSVGQGFQSMSPRLELFEELLLGGKIRHGAHPALTSGAANAIVVQDPSGNRKITKAASTQRVDVLVAAVMAAYEVGYEQVLADAGDWIFF
jgi:phage terminase large subunit-like protein